MYNYEEYKKYKSKLSMLGGFIEASPIDSNWCRVRLNKLITSSETVVIPKFINEMDIDALLECKNMEKLVTHKNLNSIANLNGDYTKSIEVDIPSCCKIVPSIRNYIHAIIILNNRCRITNNITAVPDLVIENSQHLKFIGPMGIVRCSIGELYLQSSTTSKSAIVNCVINDLHIQYPQSKYCLRKTTVINPHIYIDSKRLKAIKDKFGDQYMEHLITYCGLKYANEYGEITIHTDSDKFEMKEGS